MSVQAVRCPNCGSVASKSVNHDEYKCDHCDARFYFTKPNVQKQDFVAHNCPLCGKPIQSGSGYKCTRCGKYDLCDDCARARVHEKNMHIVDASFRTSQQYAAFNRERGS